MLVITTCRYRSSTVFLMRKGKPSNYQTVKSICRRIGGYVRHGSGLLIRMMSPVENPIIPRPRFSLFGLILKITHRWRTKWMVKIYLWEVLLCAPLSHITVSSIFKKDSICAVFASVSYHSIHSFACDYISSVSKKNPLLFTHLDTTHWKIESPDNHHHP